MKFLEVIAEIGKDPTKGFVCGKAEYFLDNWKICYFWENRVEVLHMLGGDWFDNDDFEVIEKPTKG